MGKEPGTSYDFFFLKAALLRKDIYIHNKHTIYYLELVLGTIKNKIVALGVILL